jgi:DNA-3-methyladenine glycosylase II
MTADPISYLQTDERIAPLIDEHGQLSLEPADDPFERLVVSIVRQQVSMASAEAIRERLFDAFEITPAALATADEAALKDVGLSGQKAEYVRHVGQAFQEHGYDRAYFADVPDEAVVEELTTIRGIGTWTGKMFLLFCLGREDVFPVEDLGIRNAMEVLYDADLTRAEMNERATAWAPYRSYASLYLWRHVE